MMYKDAALTCFSRGRTMGMVVDMGEEFTRCCGVIDGFVSRENVSIQRFGGARLRDLYISKCLVPFLEGQKEESARSILPRGIASISPSGKTLLWNSIGREMSEKLYIQLFLLFLRIDLLYPKTPICKLRHTQPQKVKSSLYQMDGRYARRSRADA